MAIFKSVDKTVSFSNLSCSCLYSLVNKSGIRISWLIFSLACNHRLHFPNGKTGWRGLEQMRKDCGTREFIAHPSVYLERSLSANLSDVPLTADNTRMEFST